MKKKVLFLSVAFNTGGTEKATLDIIRHINPEKYEITLCTMYNGGLYQQQLPEYVHIKYFFPRFIRYVIRYVEYFPARMVYRTFIHEKYDVEIACGDGMPSRIINGSPNKKSKKIAWIHMDVEERGYNGLGMYTKLGRKRFYNNFDKIVNVSYECERKFRNKFGSDLPTCTIYNIVDAENIVKRSLEESAVELEKGKQNIVCIGRLTYQKGFDRLIDAFGQIRERVSGETHITIIGSGEDETLLRELIRAKHLENQVKLIGYLENPYPVLKQADWFVLSSRDESFALVVAEAMVLGVPVMSTRCTGPVELLQDGKAGLLVENSTEGIRDGLLQILTDDSIRIGMTQIVQKNKNRFRIDSQIEKIEELLDK